MKILSTLIASSLALGCASLASAAVTTIHVAGSTAFRGAAVNGEIAVASYVDPITGLFKAAGGPPTTAEVGGTPTTATYSLVHGFDVNGNEICFANHWTGSVAGVTDLCSNNGIAYCDVSQCPIVAGGADNNTLTTEPDTAAPNVAMSDNVYSDAISVVSTGNAAAKAAGVNINNNAPNDGGTGAGANGGPVAAVTFEWVLGAMSSTAPAPTNWQPLSGTSVTSTGAMAYNITQDQAEVLLTTGNIPLSVVTGNNADATSYLLYVGRNEDSGSRVMYQGESWGNGVAKNGGGLGASTVQWMLQQQGVVYPANPGYASIAIGTNIIACQKWPQNETAGGIYGAGGWEVNTEPTFTWTATGHSGYNSGGDVGKIMATPNPVTVGVAPHLVFTNGADKPTGCTKAYFVTCLGTADALTVTGAGGVALSYNGVPYTANNCYNGLYALWNQEHLYYLTNGQANQVTEPITQADADAMADAIYNAGNAAYANAGLSLLNFNAVRGAGSGAYIE